MKTGIPIDSWILHLDSSQADLALAGGKGANLARLMQAGFPVPGGFVIATPAYRTFVESNGIDERIREALGGADLSRSDTLEAVSREVRACFTGGTIPPNIQEAILKAYRNLGEKPAAVRSSATAEDLPDISFAGQQETYLNVVGEDALLKAVVDCWSSLWTARAIGYRARNQVPHEAAAMAVVVQEMAPSQASGVLFTANPLTGLRTETVIDATLGLGEALVSGQVEPDHYVVDTSTRRILAKNLGMKAVSIHERGGGGTETVEQVRKDVQALPDEQILELAGLGSRVQELYGHPQDIEWAASGGKLYLLQSRPITSLFPTPENMPAEPLKVLFSFAAVQGVFDPITPMGRDLLKSLGAAAASLFGLNVTSETQTAIYEAGERLWANLTPVIRNSVGRKILSYVATVLEPTIGQATGQIWDDPRLQPEHSGIRLLSLARIGRFAAPLAANILLNLAFPDRRRRYILANGERLLEETRARLAEVNGDRYETLEQRADLIVDTVRYRIPPVFQKFVSGVAAGIASLQIMNNAAGQASEPAGDLILQATRGIPNNPTTQMDLELWETARAIKRDPASRQAFEGSRPEALSERYRSKDLPPTAAGMLGRFLEKYGGRGLGEIDLGRERWAEDPTHVFEMITSFLQIEDETQAPDVVFARGAASAEAAIERLADIAGKTPGGRIKARMVRFAGGRMRRLMGIRESPKFFAVRLFAEFRRAVLESGKAFVEAGELDDPADLFYLTFRELKAFARQEKRDWRSLTAERREANRREKLRRQIPRLLLSDGRAFYEGLSPVERSGDAITGSPVSPGRAEGRVRVVFDPSQANLQPGEIMVCPGTDPSWTPLFLSAGGLVMETGGMMTHGAVVAREYGIPAIVGVDRATERLKTGQMIQIDGSSGKITLVDDP